MDNLSHSVVGLAVGEFAHRILPQETSPDDNRLRRYLLLVACWLASNFPDLDLVLTPLLPSPLGYLLHHRGHTHTLLYAIPQALLLCGMLWLSWPAARRLLRRSTDARRGLVFVVSAGFVLHMLMDYLNSYGIHPFHPFDSRWIYGDMVFILEPVFWIVFGVPMAMTVQRLPLRILLLALLIGAPVYFTTRGFLPWASLFTLLVTAAVLGRLQHRAGTRGIAALSAAMIMILAFVVVQGLASAEARTVVTRVMQGKDAGSRVLDVSTTSFPSNPLCWAFAAVDSDEATDIYHLRRGIVSIVPEILPVNACPPSLSEGADKRPGSLAIVFVSAQQGSLQTLRALKRNNCYFSAWLRFARMPAVEGTTATDIRFSSSPRGNFTTLDFEDFKNRACPEHVPQWGFPREDLLH
jgi:inner membrane protein